MARPNRFTLATGIEVAPLVLGGNVFGWTADEGRSFEVLEGGEPPPGWESPGC